MRFFQKAIASSTYTVVICLQIKSTYQVLWAVNIIQQSNTIAFSFHAQFNKMFNNVCCVIPTPLPGKSGGCNKD